MKTFVCKRCRNDLGPAPTGENGTPHDLSTHTQSNPKINLILPRFPSLWCTQLATSIFREKTQTYTEKVALRNEFKFLFLNCICPTSSLLASGHMWSWKRKPPFCSPPPAPTPTPFPFSFFFFFWPPQAHGVPPGRGSDPSCSFNLYRSCSIARSFNPLCQAGNQTCVLVLQRCHQSCCATVGNPHPPAPHFLFQPSYLHCSEEKFRRSDRREQRYPH